MNKKLIIFGIVIILLIVGLSGCVNEQNRFVGSWTSFGMTIFTFKPDGTYTSALTKGTYEIVKWGKLYSQIPVTGLIIFLIDIVKLLVL